MASQQLKRESKNEDPKVTSRFESVSVKESGNQPTAVVHQVIETIQGGSEIHKDKPPTGQATATQQGQHKSATTESMQRKQEDEGPSLEEISKYRGTAQQNSMEAIRAAQEKYQKSKDNVRQQTKNNFDAPQAGQRGAGGVSATARREDYSLEKSGQVGRTPGVMDMTKKGVSYVGETAVAGQDLAIETGKKTARKGTGVLKDVAAKSLDTTLDMRKQGASFIGESGKDATLGAVKAAGKAVGVLKDAAIVAGWDTAEFASDKAADAIETMEDTSSRAEDVTAGIIDKTVDLGAKGASYAGETAVAGKDLAIETGKTTAEYARKGAGVLKDVAAKSADTTLDMSKQGASFVGETAIAAKDVTLGAVKATVEYAGKAAGVLKDAAVVGGWNTAEFASNKAADAIETMGDVSSKAEDVTAEIIERTVDISERGVNYIGQTVVAGKDLTLETGKTYARKGAGALKDVALGLTDTTLDMGQKGSTYAGKDVALGTGKTAAEYVRKNTKETAIESDARHKAEKEREIKIGGEGGGHRAESRASGGVGLDVTKGAKVVSDRSGFEHQQPGGLIVEGHIKQERPGGVKELGNFRLQESGGVVEGSLEHRGTGDAGGAMRMIGKTLMDAAGDNEKDSKV